MNMENNAAHFPSPDESRAAEERFTQILMASDQEPTNGPEIDELKKLLEDFRNGKGDIAPIRLEDVTPVWNGYPMFPDRVKKRTPSESKPS